MQFVDFKNVVDNLLGVLENTIGDGNALVRQTFVCYGRIAVVLGKNQINNAVNLTLTDFCDRFICYLILKIAWRSCSVIMSIGD